MDSHGRTPVLVLVTLGAPAVEPLVMAFMREGFDVEVRTDETIECVPPPAGVTFLWTRAGVDVGDCERAVAWSRQRSDSGLLGCAPLGTSLDTERALAAGFDDFVAGRGSPRELVARVRSVARRVASPRNRYLHVAGGSGARHAGG